MPLKRKSNAKKFTNLKRKTKKVPLIYLFIYFFNNGNCIPLDNRKGELKEFAKKNQLVLQVTGVISLDSFEKRHWFMIKPLDQIN